MRILRGSRVSRVFAFLLATVLTMTMHGSSSSSEDTSNFVVVETSSGKVLGRKEGNLNVYLGIPYAEPPVGRYRFRPPRRKSPWYPATYRALDFAPECLQSALYTSDPDEDVSRTAGMDEDCLYLNIWQPAKGQKAARDNLPLLPVMIWIYGGAFLHGSASKPEYFGNKLASSRNVIIVSLNYRLGALGFLVSTADGLYGNYGLDDQKTAIQWVKKNIIHFGGDPDRITLFGESAGAMSIGLHMLDQEKRMKRQYRRTATTRSSSSGAQYDSDTHTTTGRSRGYEDDADIGDDDSSEGEDEEGEAYSRSEYRGEDAHKLFHAVILQSNPLGYKYRSISVANFIGTSYKEYLDCEDLRCLQSESPEELMHVQDTLMAVPRSIGDFFTWGPVVTDSAYYREVRLRPGPVANVTVVQPMEALKELRKLEVPVLMGTNTHEGTVFVFTAYPTRMTKIIYQALVFSFFRTSAPKILGLYAPLTKILSQSAYPDYRLVLSRIIGDYLFRCPNQYFAAQLAATGAAVFHYEFALATRTPGFPCCDGLACHTSELPYVFNQLGVIESDYSWQDANSVTSASTGTTGNTPVDLDPNRLVPSLASAGSSAATSSASTSSAGTSSAGTGGVGGGSESEGVGAGSGSGSASGSGMGTMGSIAAESVGSGTADNLMGGIFQASRPLSPDQASLDTADVLLRDSPPQVPPPPSQLLNTTMPSTPQQQRSSRTEGYAFPDIFGAASTWLNGAGAHLAHSTGLRGKVSRSVVDAEVSRIMSEFWTTFAAYGDPNGQPAHSSGRTSGRYVSTSNNNRRGHSSGDLNGYVSGSCAEGVPWWPRVLGDIPSRQEMQEMQRKAYSTTATPAPPSPTPAAAVSGTSRDSRGHEQEGTYFWQRDEDSAAQFPYAPSSRYSKSAEAKGEGISDSPEDDLDGGDSAGDNAPTIRSTVGRGDSNWAEIVVRSSPPKTRNSARTKQELYAGSRHTNKELISRYTRNLRSVVTKYMHHMVFDEESSVNIVQNDCICNQWNALEYRF